MSCLRPTKRYGVIYADPPWNFKNFSDKGTGRNAVAHYACMDFAKLAAWSHSDGRPRIACCSFGRPIPCFQRPWN